MFLLVVVSFFLLNHVTGVVFKPDADDIVPLSLGKRSFELFKFFFLVYFFLHLREGFSSAVFDRIDIEGTLGGEDDGFFEPKWRVVVYDRTAGVE